MAAPSRTRPQGRRLTPPALLAVLLTIVGLPLLAPASAGAVGTTQITLKLSPPAITADGKSASTATATIDGVPPFMDTVQFSSSDSTDTVVPDMHNPLSNTYTASITSKNPGQSTITATDTTAGVSATATLTKNAPATSSTSATVLTVSPGNPVTNQQVTLLAAITATPAPSGTVTFHDGGAPIAGCTGETITSTSPNATCQTSFAAGSSPHTITATYTPSTSGAAGSSSQSVLTVGKDTTTTGLAGNVSGHSGNRVVTYTATVNPAHTGPLAPTGFVQFRSGGSVIAQCAHQSLSVGTGGVVATCTPGTHTRIGPSLTAEYLGDGNFLSSDSQPAQAVGAITSTMAWSFSYTPHYTVVRKLRVHGAQPGAKIVIKCSGKGCPFHVRTKNVTSGCAARSKHSCGRTIALDSRFGKHHLAVGSRIVVEVLRPNWIGKYYSFTIRSGRGPRIKISCLAPGANRPGVGC
jgi:hypothetical protein